MKKIILSLFVLLSLSTFTQEKYKIEIEPSAKIFQNAIQDYNSQIEKEVSKIYSKEEMFGLMNKMMNGASVQGKNGENDLKELMNGFFGEDYISKMMDIMFKYYKIEIEKKAKKKLLKMDKKKSISNFRLFKKINWRIRKKPKKQIYYPNSNIDGYLEAIKILSSVSWSMLAPLHGLYRILKGKRNF